MKYSLIVDYREFLIQKERKKNHLNYDYSFVWLCWQDGYDFLLGFLGGFFARNRGLAVYSQVFFRAEAKDRI